VGIPVTLEVIESPQGGNLGDLGGNEMESEEMKEGPPKGQDIRCVNAWERVLVIANSFQEIRTHVKSVIPTRDTRTRRVYMYNVMWTSKLGFCP
jgi:hypothetical protein